VWTSVGGAAGAPGELTARDDSGRVRRGSIAAPAPPLDFRSPPSIHRIGEMADQASLAKGRALGNVLVGFAMLAICLLASSVSAEGCGPR